MKNYKKMKNNKRVKKFISKFNILNSVIVILSIVMITFTFSIPVLGQISIDGRYWEYKNQKTLLIGGWNHGHNPFIDHDTQDNNGSQGVSTEAEIKNAINELADVGGNLLRCVLNPGMAAGIQGFNFCATSENKYDFNTMTGPFWTRLEMFIAEAEAKGIIIQIEIWDRFDLIDGAWKSWPVSPFNPNNNINYTTGQSGLATSYSSYGTHPFLKGVPGHPDYIAASSARKAQYDLVRGFQEKFVDKMLSVTFKYNNILYCMNNETHEDPKWGEYWIDYIRNKASSAGKTVLVTDMSEYIYEGVTGSDWQYASTNLDMYDYIDVSQATNRNRDENSWNLIKGIADDAKNKNILLHMTKVYGNDIALNGKPWGTWRPGDTDNAIEEWWRSLIAGVAGIRFHRPTTGIGISNIAKNNIKSVRLIEEKIKFWDVEPHQELLGDRESDEAYLAADPGKKYILYYTENGQGMVTLDLSNYSDTYFEVNWVNISLGIFDTNKTTTIIGGSIVPINRPAPGHWVGTIVETTSQSPSQSSNPSPADSAKSISTFLNLSWLPGSVAASHDIYFGTNSPPPFIGSQSAASYNLAALDINTTYYWRIDEVNSIGTTTGTEWSFSTEAVTDGSIMLEAEDGTGTSSFADDYAGYNGTGYEYLNANEYVEWNVSMSAGNGALTFRYGCDGTMFPEIKVNENVIPSSEKFESGGRGTWRANVSIDADFKAGNNTIRITNIAQWILDIDYMEISGTVTSVNDMQSEIIPHTFAIGNYPNPFNPSTTITYELPEKGFVTLIVYDIAGQNVVELVNGEINAGSHNIKWNAQSSSGQSVTSGVYLYQIRYNQQIKTSKMIYLR
ncbi:MAG: T9SS type A sorting domain-containing protein [Melioribacteraceae bacterium]|nr:T9SS type A sorting domain-containing protein [Melioribacteraceae bacterium]